MQPRLLDVLTEAHKQLLERGWTQDILRDHEGHVCLAGAVEEGLKATMLKANGQNGMRRYRMNATFVTDLRRSALDVVARAIHARYRWTRRHSADDSVIEEWNDKPSRKESQVHAVLDDAIYLAKELEA